MPAVRAVLQTEVQPREPVATSPASSPDAFKAALTKASQNVSPSHTPMGGEEAASALSSAYQSVTGHTPTAKQLALLVSQWSLETGGGRSMMNYNFGGIKGHGPSGLTTAYKTKEGYGETERTIVDHFRAYKTPEEGATDYLRTLAARFPKSFAAVRSGDATAFAHTLKREGYYTGSEADYTRAIESMSNRAQKDGFASLGHGGAHVVPKVAPPEDADPLRSLDALAMSDHMTLSALRILGMPDDNNGGNEAALFATKPKGHR